MRLIGHIDNAEQARTFGDYLYVQGIHNEMDREDNGTFAVWIADEDAVEKSKTMLEAFRRDPTNPDYKRVAGGADNQRKAEQKDEEAARKRVIKARQLYPEMRPYGVGPLTFTLIVVCGLIAYHTGFGKNARPIYEFYISEYYPQAGWLLEVRAGQIWRLFTPVLMHGNPAHIIMNMLALFQVGSLIESRKGTGYFALLVLVTAVGSNLTEYFWKGPAFLGMSGVVFGLFGYAWMCSKYDPGSGLFMPPQSVIMMMIWMFACIFLIPGMANGAHVGGLLVGVAWGLIASNSERGR